MNTQKCFGGKAEHSVHLNDLNIEMQSDRMTGFP